GSFRLYLMNSDGTDQAVISVPVEGELPADEAPAWSPDGRFIAFVSERDYNPEIYVTTPDGSLLLRLTNYDGEERWPAFRPDPRLLPAS
ncbi:MAG TPA: hypothetical protein QGG37_05670, partial [Chloroflexota bacterium]|nr:hypothetical protein [Chloroflexota bacterium]